MRGRDAFGGVGLSSMSIQFGNRCQSASLGIGQLLSLLKPIPQVFPCHSHHIHLCLNRSFFLGGVPP